MNSDQNHLIPLNEAAELTATFRNLPQAILAGILTNVKGEAFGKADLLTILNQPECTGVRIYFGAELLPVPKIRLIIVGVNVAGNDLYQEIILENGMLCPPNCSTNNPLNT